MKQNGTAGVLVGLLVMGAVAGCGSAAGPTRADEPDGVSDCGPRGDERCAASQLVTGGTFSRSNLGDYPATVSSFRLDTYEVTVGRFREFVNAWVSGWRPTRGAGKHSHLNGGQGLAGTADGFEQGWDPAWSETFPTLAAEWDRSLLCDGASATWTASAGANEKRPVTCISWYEAYAFCIWDGGGFLPSEAEWDYAAEGGSEQRTYAWGNTEPGANAVLAVHSCYYNGTGSCFGVTNVAPVGSATAGAGKWGQLDLNGNVGEWTFDAVQSPYAPECHDCTGSTADPRRATRGGNFALSAITSQERFGSEPTKRGGALGARCARTP